LEGEAIILTSPWSKGISRWRLPSTLHKYGTPMIKLKEDHQKERKDYYSLKFDITLITEKEIVYFCYVLKGLRDPAACNVKSS